MKPYTARYKQPGYLTQIFREKKRRPMMARGYCHSMFCQKNLLSAKGKLVTTDRRVTFCPRCGHALVWKYEQD